MKTLATVLAATAALLTAGVEGYKLWRGSEAARAVAPGLSASSDQPAPVGGCGTTR